MTGKTEFLYCVAVVVPRGNTQRIIVASVIATSEAEAEGMVLNHARNQCPASEGWSEPATQVMRVSDEYIRRAGVALGLVQDYSPSLSATSKD